MSPSGSVCNLPVGSDEKEYFSLFIGDNFCRVRLFLCVGGGYHQERGIDIQNYENDYCQVHVLDKVEHAYK